MKAKDQILTLRDPLSSLECVAISMVLEQTDLSRKFHEFPWVSMQFYAHAPCRIKKIPIV